MKPRGVRASTRGVSARGCAAAFASAALAFAAVVGGVVPAASAADSAADSDVVVFVDAALEKCVASAVAKPVGSVTEGDLAKLHDLLCTPGEIADIEPLKYARNLVTLYIDGNKVSDLSPLSQLQALRKLFVSHNEISDLAPLSRLTGLNVLEAGDNQIADATPLSGLVNLETLSVPQNQLRDVSALAGLGQLVNLQLGDNQLSDLSALASLRNLNALILYSNEIADLRPLANLTQLGVLMLADNAISDLRPLAQLRGIRSFWLNEQRIPQIAATAGAPAALPSVYLPDGTALPLSVGSGSGSISQGAVTWAEPGPAELTWTAQVAHIEGAAEFSGVIPVAVSEAPLPTLTLQGAPTPGQVGVAYEYAFEVTYGATVQLAVGELPQGLTLSPTGVLSGTPTVAGDSTFTLTAANGVSPAVTLRDVTLRVAPAHAVAVVPAAQHPVALAQSGGGVPFWPLGLAGGMIAAAAFVLLAGQLRRARRGGSSGTLL